MKIRRRTPARARRLPVPAKLRSGPAGHRGDGGACIHGQSGRAGTQSEEQLHRQVAKYLAAVLHPTVLATTFPAGGGGRVRGAKLKAMGLVPGMPDWLIWWLVPSVLGRQCLGIELKSAKGTMSKAQRDVQHRMEQVGASYALCRSVEDVELILRACRVPMKGKLA